MYICIHTCLTHASWRKRILEGNWPPRIPETDCRDWASVLGWFKIVKLY